MSEDFSSRDDKLTAECARLLAQNEAALRADVLRKIVLPNLSRLRGGNPARWNQEGWYAATEEHDRTVPDAFPVPHACANWYPREQDGAIAFRFFHTEAFLDLPVPHAPCRVEFDILHSVLPEAVTQFSLHACGVPLPLSLSASALPLHVEAALDEEVQSRARVEGRLRLTMRSPIAAIPALLYPASTDRPRLSVAISYPFLTA